MTLTNKHITYENKCRELFLEQTIRAVIYGELKYLAEEEGSTVRPEPSYHTKYPDIDTLDYSVYLKTDTKTIYIFWDNTFISYGLQSKLIDLKETTNEYEQKWDVSSEPKWTDIIGQKIIDFKIIWEKTWTSNLDGSNKMYTSSPQTFVVRTENGNTILLSASEFKRDTDEILPLMDNLLVTTNLDLAKFLRILD
ncbi:MAG: hypothetical protein CFE21_03550 [Bacteroidetes bacterium B1(2017)]|nr:MAG: hypothetical protein CFE21_03550 [Bacteroidetes bacterium B1(2017)]